MRAVTAGLLFRRERQRVDPEHRPPPGGLVRELPRERDPERVVACFVGLAVAAALFFGLTRPNDVVAPPARSAGSTPVAGTIFVHVAGAVRRPGVYELAMGARVKDAIEAAGGALRTADLASVNFAAPAIDGAQIVLATQRASGDVHAAVPRPSAPALVNLNSADQAALESIPGVGPVTAEAILGYRSEIGAFTSLDQLLDVDGIGPATIESLRPYVTL